MSDKKKLLLNLLYLYNVLILSIGFNTALDSENILVFILMIVVPTLALVYFIVRSTMYTHTNSELYKNRMISSFIVFFVSVYVLSIISARQLTLQFVILAVIHFIGFKLINRVE